MNDAFGHELFARVNFSPSFDSNQPALDSSLAMGSLDVSRLSILDYGALVC
jgi:hypothetical protein